MWPRPVLNLWFFVPASQVLSCLVHAEHKATHTCLICSLRLHNHLYLKDSCNIIPVCRYSQLILLGSLGWPGVCSLRWSRKENPLTLAFWDYGNAPWHLALDFSLVGLINWIFTYASHWTDLMLVTFSVSFSEPLYCTLFTLPFGNRISYLCCGVLLENSFVSVPHWNCF